MSLNQKTINEFLEILSSSAPAPGGGSVASLEGAIASSLIHMVASVTKGKEKYLDVQDFTDEVLKESNSYLLEFQELIDEDVKAFNEVSKVFVMPKEKEEDRINRKKAMQEALKIAIIPPLKVMQLANKVSLMIEECIKKLNQNALSDLGVACLTLNGALKSAYLNVLINLSSINDEDFKKNISEESQKLLKNTENICNYCYNLVVNKLE